MQQLVVAKLCQQILNDLPPLVRQSHAEALVRNRQPPVVEAELMQDSGVQIVDVDRVLDDGPADVVGLAIGEAPLKAAAGHPDAEGERMMIAAEFKVRLAP